MINLLLAVICSSSIALLFTLSETRNLNRYAVTSVNYAAAAVVGIAAALKDGLFNFSEWSFSAFQQEIGTVLTGEEIFTPAAAPFWAAGVGLFSGWLFVGSFLLYQKSVRLNGPSLSGMFGKLGILLPVLLSLLLWREYPLPAEWLGIGLAVVALIFPSLAARLKPAQRRSPPVLGLLFLAMGLAEFSNKLFQAYAPALFSTLFLAILFISAFFASLVLLILRSRVFAWRELLLGLAVGIPNILSSWFLIQALGDVKAAVAFPFYSVGGMTLIALGGVLFFRERLSRTDYTALILAGAALLLLA